MNRKSELVRAPVASISKENMKKKTLQNSVDDLDKKQLFQLVFLSDDENQGVEVKEVEEINFTEVKMRLEDGDSIFITRKENKKVDATLFDREVSRKESEKPW